MAVDHEFVRRLCDEARGLQRCVAILRRSQFVRDNEQVRDLAAGGAYMIKVLFIVAACYIGIWWIFRGVVANRVAACFIGIWWMFWGAAATCDFFANRFTGRWGTDYRAHVITVGVLFLLTGVLSMSYGLRSHARLPLQKKAGWVLVALYVLSLYVFIGWIH